MIFKNTAGQGVYLFAVDSAGAAKTGDAANITGAISKDGAASAAPATVHPTEIGAGIYWQPLSQGETNANAISISWASSTSGVTIDPLIAFTTAGAVPQVAAGASGGLSLVGSAMTLATDAVNAAALAASAVTKIQTGLSTLDAAGVRTAIGLAAANLDAQLAAIGLKTTNLPADPADASDIAAEFTTVLSALATIAGRLPIRLTKNTAFANFQFYLVQSVDHLSPKTGATVTAERLQDADSAFEPCDNSAVEVEAGMYRINLSAADLNGNCITLRFSASGADDRIITVITQL